MPLPVRELSLHAVLLVASLSATGLWLRAQARPGPRAEVEVPAAPPAEAAPVIFPAASVPPPPPAVDDAQRVRELARRSLATQESLEILAALEGMASTTTSESLEALSVLASRNEDVEVRREAVEVLRRLAANRGDADGSIRNALRGLNDGIDTQVAERGQDIAAEMDATPGGFAQASSAAILSQDQYAATEPMP